MPFERTRGRALPSAALLVSVMLAGALAGCSSTEEIWVEDPEPPPRDAGADARPSPDSGRGVLAFMPTRSYSGFDGARTFTVPVAVYDAGDDLRVTATDPSAADIVPKKLVGAAGDNGKYFFVTVKKAGTITLQATSGGQTVETTIDVADYAPGRWAAGEARYVNGGGGDPACASCHAGGSAIDHSPAALATATDEKIGVVITTGISTHGFPIKINGAPGHQWTVSDAERDGLVTYLRSLEPRGFE